MKVYIVDAETTGLRKDSDQIIELSIRYGLEEDAITQTWLFRPSVPIHPDAQKVHGLTKEDLKDCPTFADEAESVKNILESADVIVGYNLRFDLEMIQTEFKRTGQKTPDLSNKIVIDGYRLWQVCEPRTLADAHQVFLESEIGIFHRAADDTAATSRVLNAMLIRFKLEGKSWEEIADLIEPDRASWIGPSHHIQWASGHPIIAFGKHNESNLSELATSEDRSYLEWMISKDFPLHVKEVCEMALLYSESELIAELIERFGGPIDV